MSPYSPASSSPHSVDPSPLGKVLYDYSHSPTAQITAITLSPSIAGAAGLAREVGGASPRKKFGGLFKAQKPKAKLSKSAHQKLKESLRIFDFSSDSGSDDEEDTPPVKKPVRPKAPPTIKMADETEEVNGEGSLATPKPKSNVNYRYIQCTCIL